MITNDNLVKLFDYAVRSGTVEQNGPEWMVALSHREPSQWHNPAWTGSPGIHGLAGQYGHRRTPSGGHVLHRGAMAEKTGYFEIMWINGWSPSIRPPEA